MDLLLKSPDVTLATLTADETPWRQHGRLRWLWVVLSSTTAIFHIGSRQGDEIRDLIGDAFLGWLVSDGYGAYRKFKKRQRCLAHLIRKGIALAGGLNPQGAHFGAWLLREVRGLIHEVAEGTGARIVNPMLARLKRACKLHRDDDAEKVRALAREILNDWTAITAFVTNPDLPASRVDDWRGSDRSLGSCRSPAAFARAGASFLTMAPFPVAAHQ